MGCTEKSGSSRSDHFPPGRHSCMKINYHTHYLFSFIVIASGLVACTSTGGRMDAVADAYADILRYRDAHVRSDTMTVRAGVIPCWPLTASHAMNFSPASIVLQTIPLRYSPFSTRYRPASLKQAVCRPIHRRLPTSRSCPLTEYTERVRLRQICPARTLARTNLSPL